MPKDLELEEKLKEKEILEYVDNFVPETNLEKIAYAQYIQNKQLNNMVKEVNRLLGYIISRV